LKSDSEFLLSGFHSFVASQERDDVDHSWSLCQALLASRLVAARIGSDPVTTEEFRDATFLLDTNALIVTALEMHRLADPLEELGRALKSIGGTLGFIEDTRGEYTRVVSSKRGDVLKAVERYPASVLDEATDPFLTTAVSRHCRTETDVARFFNELLDPPTMLAGEIPIRVVNEPGVLTLAAQGAADEKLKAEIAAMWAQYRRREKSTAASAHDAALTTVAEGLRTVGEKCFVLTLDRTMHEHSLQRAGPHGLPQWISLDALIQILAVDNAGPHHDAADFGPLMAAILRHQLGPILGTYAAEDLAIMIDLEERCGSLPADQIQGIATDVARERLRGRSRHDPELALVVQRGFSKAKFHLADETVRLTDRLQEATVALRSRDTQLTTERASNEAGVDQYIATRAPELRRAADRKAGLSIIGGLIAITVLTRLILGFVDALVPDVAHEWVDLFISLMAPVFVIGAWLVQKVLPRWRAERASAIAKARGEIESRMAAARG
jgi:hypothetical protein